MPPVPPPRVAELRQRRAGPRVSFPELTPAVLRFSDGGRTTGTLKLVSVTGGLLGLSRPIMPNSMVKLMFVGPTGSVFGTAKMLNPVSWSLQPFCFTTLHDDDQYKLKTAIQRCVEKSARENNQSRRDQLQIEKFRPW
ncbi:MAG: hypothetical protein JOZ80_06755 [Acidobacteriaceae bacterium]|nr:hypothetical protein [Acidobacteriaceae bacterium]